MWRLARGEKLCAERFKWHRFGEVFDEFQHLHRDACKFIPSHAAEDFRQVVFETGEELVCHLKVADFEGKGRVFGEGD